MIVSFLNQKGGVGKTTLSINVAHGLQLQGDKVLFVDSDPQGSARNWHSASEGEHLKMISLDRPTIDKDIKGVDSGYDWVFIDGAPQLSMMAAKTIKCSDIVLIPIQPSPYDMWASSDIVQLIKERQALFDIPKCAFVITRSRKNTILSKEIREVLKEYDLPIFDSFTTDRSVYKQSASIGETVFSASNQEAVQEMMEIINELRVLANEQ